MIRCIKSFTDARNGNVKRRPGEEWAGSKARVAEINAAMRGEYAEYFSDYPTADEIAAAVVEAISPLIQGDGTPEA